MKNSGRIFDLVIINCYTPTENKTKDKDIKAGFEPQTRILSDESGTLITEEKQIVKHFTKYFNQLLNQPVVERKTMKLTVIIQQNRR